MFKAKSILISHYINKEARTNSAITIVSELNRISSGAFKNQIEYCRQLYNQGQLKESKAVKGSLPVVTFSGLFNDSHSSENLQSYSKILVIDIDNLSKERLESTKAEIFLDQHVFAVWVSPTGTGLKLLVATQSNEGSHKIYFNEICNYLYEKYEIQVDKSGSDVCRLCFTSYDPQLLVKDECVPFFIDIDSLLSTLMNKKTSDKVKPAKISPDVKIEKILFYSTEGKNAKSDRDYIDRIIKYLKIKGLSITETYNEWYKVALAISNTFTYDLGKKYYLYLCRLDGASHDEEKSLKMLEYCYLTRRLNEVNFATILYMAEKKGFRK